jgi:hypothetical protein
MWKFDICMVRRHRFYISLLLGGGWPEKFYACGEGDTSQWCTCGAGTPASVHLRGEAPASDAHAGRGRLETEVCRNLGAQKREGDPEQASDAGEGIPPLREMPEFYVLS